jgi:hypothetical protein
MVANKCAAVTRDNSSYSGFTYTYLTNNELSIGGYVDNINYTTIGRAFEKANAAGYRYVDPQNGGYYAMEYGYHAPGVQSTMMYM